MAHTTPTPHDLTSNPSPERVREVMEAAQDLYERALGDSDKASDAYDVCFYDGMADALCWVLDLLTAEESTDDDQG